MKFFSAIELIALLADPDWLDEATKTIGQFWRRKNARRNCLTNEEQTDVTVVVRKNQLDSKYDLAESSKTKCLRQTFPGTPRCRCRVRPNIAQTIPVCVSDFT